MVAIGFSLQLTTKPRIVKLRLGYSHHHWQWYGDKQDAGGEPLWDF